VISINSVFELVLTLITILKLSQINVKKAPEKPRSLFSTNRFAFSVDL
jgi:hypothetical protein